MKKILNSAVILLSSLVIICYSANVSFNQIGDVRVSYDGKTLTCDRIRCPEKTVRCIATKKTLDNDNTQIERLSRCFNSNNEILLEDRHNEMNPKPHSKIDIKVEHGIGGTYYK